MGIYTWLFIIVGTIILIVTATHYFTWWAKSLAVIYYGGLTFLFIINTNRINQKYSGIIPVPEAYWDENSEWASTASHLFLLPFIGILFYLYYRWFTNAQTITAIIFLTISLLPAAALVFLFYFIIDFGYGYRP